MAKPGATRLNLEPEGVANAGIEATIHDAETVGGAYQSIGIALEVIATLRYYGLETRECVGVPIPLGSVATLLGGSSRTGTGAILR